jgi:AcrR family transcriptional regulator
MLLQTQRRNRKQVRGRQGSDHETRERLREAARDLFADRGFNRVSVREICHAARANVAAINYHFGDKFGLYMDIIRESIAIMRESNELAQDAGRGMPADDRLRAFLRVFLERISGSGDKTSWMSRIMSREMEDPTPALDEVVKQAIEPRLKYLGEAIAELLHCDLDDARVKYCFASVHGQCFIYRPHLMRERLLGVKGKIDVEAVAHHIAEFSLAGIRALADPAPSPTSAGRRGGGRGRGAARTPRRLTRKEASKR